MQGRCLKVILFMLISLSFSACRGLRSFDDVRSDKDELESPDGLSLMSQGDITPLKRIYALRIDDADFRVNGVRVGEQIFLLKSTPIVIYEIPKDADYIQILRCPSSTIISDGDDILENVEFSSKDLQTESMVFRRNNFWEAATQASGCVLTASAHSDPYFLDPSAPSGNYLYYVRACIEPAHIVGFNEISKYNCSRQVTRSVEYKHKNLRESRELDSLLRLSRLEARTHEIARQILQKNTLLSNSLLNCQERSKARVVTNDQLKQIKTISTLVGAGVGAAAGGSLAAYKNRKNFSVENPTNTRLKAAGSVAAGAIIGAGLSAQVGFLVGSAIEAWNKPLSGYPKDDPSCYVAKEPTLASQGAQDLLVETGQIRSVCSCADALAIQVELKNLGQELSDIQALISSGYEQIEGPLVGSPQEAIQ